MSFALTLRRKLAKLYRGFIEPSAALTVRGRPRLEVSLARTFGDYRQCLALNTDRHSEWLRTAWLDTAKLQGRLYAYCGICRAWTHLEISHPCFDVDGRSVPRWRETLTCPSCHMNNRIRLSLQVLEQVLTPPADARIYLTEGVTPLHAYLATRFAGLIGSELLRDGTLPGKVNGAGVRCEDLTALTFLSESFDYVVSLEVLEHIPDYKAALRECARVLRPGGALLLTAPFHGNEHNLVRARVAADGEIEHLETPEYHGDPLAPEGVLCFYHFGWELVEDLRAAGFRDVTATMCWSKDLGYLGENLVQFVARR